MKSKYPVVIGGDNFGCGSSREHAPVAMGAAGELISRSGCRAQALQCHASKHRAGYQSIDCAGAKVVVSQSYARIFFRNCVSTCVFPRRPAPRCAQMGMSMHTEQQAMREEAKNTDSLHTLLPISEARQCCGSCDWIPGRWWVVALAVSGGRRQPALAAGGSCTRARRTCACARSWRRGRRSRWTWRRTC